MVLMVVCVGCTHRQDAAPGDGDTTPVRGGTLEIVGQSDVDHLTTTGAFTVYAIWEMQPLARQLFAYPPSDDVAIKMQPMPDLAREVPTRDNGGVSADGLSYTIRIRRGVRWNSAPPRDVVAGDVVLAFKMLCNPVVPAGPLSLYQSLVDGLTSFCDGFAQVAGTVDAIRRYVDTHEITGVRAIDDHTLALRLTGPAPELLNLLALPFASPIPAEHLDYLPDSPESRQHTISNGPYQIVRYIQNQLLVMERNPAWDPDTDPLRPAYVDRIRIRLGVDPQLQQLQIEAGTADLGVEPLRGSDVGPMLAIDDPTMWLSPSGDVYGVFAYVLVNHLGPNNDGALRKREVRRAISLAANRAATVQVMGGPRVARPLYQAVTSSVTGFAPGADRDATPDHRGDPEAARRLLAVAGHSRGLKVTLAYPLYASFPVVAQVLQASLARVGIDVRLLPLTTGDLYGRLLGDFDHARRGDWDLAVTGMLPDWFGANNARTLVPLMYDGRLLGANSPNYGGFRNAAVDAAIDRAIAAPTLDRAEAEWRAVAGLVMEDLGVVPLAETKTAFARARRVRNCTWSVIGLNCDLNAVWLADAPAPRAKTP
jgi:ABC-type transport system substrate-binding protein